MIISSNMLQPLASNDVSCAGSFAEQNEVSPGQQPVKTNFNKVFAKAVRTTSGTASQGTAAGNSGEGQTVSFADLSMDETNAANAKTALSKIMTILKEIKLSLTEKTEENSESAEQSGAANVSTPAVPSELLQKLETLVMPNMAGTEGLLPMLTKESSSEEKFAPLQEAVRELKQALEKTAVQNAATDSRSAITAFPFSVPELLPIQSVKQTMSAGQNTDTPMISAREQLSRTWIDHAMSGTVSTQTVAEQVQQQQTEATEPAKSAASELVGDSFPKVVKGTNADGFLLRSVNPLTTRVIEQTVNGPKSDTAAKYAEHADFTSIALVSSAAASKGSLGFTDGGAQQNTGGKGGNSTANPTPVTNAGVIDLVVQNQSQPQSLSQPENARVPIQEHIMNQVKEKLAQFEPTSKVGNITMKLNPGELGELKINMRMEDMRLKVDIVAQNQMVKDTIMQNIDSLRDMMSRQNITIDRFDVSTGGGQGSNQAFREGRNAAGSMPYMPYDVTPASGEEIMVQKAGYWDSGENQLVNLRF